MGEDFALHGCWSIAMMVKQALACWRRLDQKTMKPTMPGVGFALRFYQALISKELVTQESIMDPML